MTAEDHSDHLRLELDLLEGELAPASQADRQTSGESGKAVLVVGPDAELRQYIGRCLSADGDGMGSILEARDGGGALRILAQQQITLIVAEADMPGVDGLELCRRVARRDGAERPPIVLIVEQGVTSELEKDYQAEGATRLLSKPFSAKRLCAAVRGVLTEPSSADTPGRQSDTHRGGMS